MATVVMLVILRLSLGCHFLYEGVWKITNARVFTAEPFLSQAKGPAAKFFCAMLPDIDGRQRLRVETDQKGQKIVKGEDYVNAWNDLRLKFVDRYKPSEKQQKQAEDTFVAYRKSLESYLAQHLDEIAGYFGSLDRLQEEQSSGADGAAYRQKRLWDKQQELRREVNGWLSEIDALGEDYGKALWDLLDRDQQSRGSLSAGWNPLQWTRMEQINFAVTYGLTAIGLCLMLGLCTRLASLGGAAFMIFVILTQPSWPTIYPPAPPVVGHALLVNKDWIEMVALFLLASTPAGRWGGLDFFLHHWCCRRLTCCFRPKGPKGTAE